MKKYDLEDTDENIKLTIEKNNLNRNKKIITLSKMLTNLNDNYIISIDGAWGSGKTFFVKQFKYLLEHISEYTDNCVFCELDKDVIKKCSNNNLVVYYNAWINDNHNGYPLESIIYSILNDYPNYKSILPNFDGFKKIFKDFTNNLIYKISYETIDISSIDKIKSFEDYAKEINTIEEKKNIFNKLINYLLNDDKRLILIIDELDRCKPTFAVELLETIKHFYNNKKITILLSTNNCELAHTIKKVYGNEFNGYGYLNKFYDCIVNLDNNNEEIEKFLENNMEFNGDGNYSIKVVKLLFNYYHFSLRECNKYISLYNLLFNYIVNYGVNVNNYILIPLAIIFKIKNIELYNLFMNNNADDEIRKVMNYLLSNDKFKYIKKDIINIESDEEYVEKVIDGYHKIFIEKHVYDKYPFFEVLSMLGTYINIKDN